MAQAIDTPDPCLSSRARNGGGSRQTPVRDASDEGSRIAGKWRTPHPRHPWAKVESRFGRFRVQRMTRRLIERRVVLASHNAGKVREIAALLAPYEINVLSAAALNLAEPEETEPDFAGNALIKAHSAAKAARLPALADDSGLCVDALAGEPGVHSARWAGLAKDFGLGMRKVHDKLLANGSTDRGARFVCALALSWPDGHAEVFEGEVEGTLVWPPRGARGFGYDSMFVPKGHDLTFGEMEPEKKQAMTHRARAFAKLVEACLE